MGGGAVVRLAVDDGLRALLTPRRRTAGVVTVPHDPTASVGHVVQSVGVPLTEVGDLRVAGVAVPVAHRLAGGDVVEVPVRPRPQPLDGPPRLLLDVHLGTLARRLRLLGVDVAWHNDAADDALVAQAAADDRLLLTQDRGLLRRRTLRRAAFVRGSDPDDQLADVLDRFALPLAPYSRCTACGAPVHDVDKRDVADRLEPGTRRTQERFVQCSACARVYWRGAHAARLDDVVRRHVPSYDGG